MCTLRYRHILNAHTLSSPPSSFHPLPSISSSLLLSVSRAQYYCIYLYNKYIHRLWLALGMPCLTYTLHNVHIYSMKAIKDVCFAFSHSLCARFIAILLPMLFPLLLHLLLGEWWCVFTLHFSTDTIFSFCFNAVDSVIIFTVIAMNR